MVAGLNEGVLAPLTVEVYMNVAPVHVGPTVKGGIVIVLEGALDV
jgi:hypothetical protein